MNASKKIITIAASASLMAGCHSAKSGVAGSSAGSVESVPVSVEAAVASAAGGIRPVAVVAMARIYRTNGDYADCVPVTLNSDRTAVVSFPAPSDLTGAAPVQLKDGYLLDRRGVGVNTAFTSYTYASYSKLKQPPTPEDLLKSVIPGAKVTEIVGMPFVAGSADEVARCDSLIEQGLPGCKRLYPNSVAAPMTIEVQAP
ncbi:MAG: hypothetical protein K2J65_03380 [Duncaniella sp.]|nr:hypothetical protein [Duncaniella sp.]